MFKHLNTLTDLKTMPPAEIHTNFGGKAWGLYSAQQINIRIPMTWLISTKWYEQFRNQHQQITQEKFLHAAEQFILQNFQQDFTELPEGLYAVRSSSQFEDTEQQSFAGIFVSELHVSKFQLAQAIAKVWASCFSARVESYFDEVKSLTMAVLLQPMLQAEYAGICFSRHPSPATAQEDQQILLEVAQAEGEKIVQGELTPLRISGNIEQVATCVSDPWMQDLLSALLELKNSLLYEIDMEFVVDQQRQFYLVQQRPLSTHYRAKNLNLENYFRAYKRSLFCLDIEMLIEGCSEFLAAYLEVPYQLNLWMIMTTSSQGAQELWLQRLINQAVTNRIVENIQKETHYLTRMHERYQRYHQHITDFHYEKFFQPTQPLSTRFLNWIDFIKPLHAHYYVPMFMIDALTQLLLLHMRKIDQLNAESDLMTLGTAAVRTLGDFLNEELLAIKHQIKSVKKFSELEKSVQQQLRKLARQYGFLKCHQVYETGYSAEELFTLACNLEERTQQIPISHADLYTKYISNTHFSYLFEQFQLWMNIRNQQMEYLMYAVLSSRPLFEEIAKQLAVTVKEIWSVDKKVILECLHNNNNVLLKNLNTKNLSIFRADGKTQVTSDLRVIYPELGEHNASLRGKTIFGAGQLKAKVKIAFAPNELKNFTPTEKYILVTGMTTPDYVPFLKNFAALITDEGGILCHAAIIAREIQLPAIVGTGLATELLKDGDVIILDFDRGEIFKDH